MRVRSIPCSFVVAMALLGCGGDDTGGKLVVTDTGSATETSADTGGGSDATDTGTAADALLDTSGSDAPGDTGAAARCAEYCTTVMANCTGTKNKQYIDNARCLSMCGTMTPGTAGEMSGDTVGCRLTHALAAKDEPNLNCPRAGATGGGKCGANRCDAMCKLAIAQCGMMAPFPNEADCKTECAKMTFNATAASGEIDQTPKTLNCVQYHLQAAYQSSAAATTHCSHLTVASGPCG